MYRIARKVEDNKPVLAFIAYRQDFEFVIILSDLNANLEQASEFSLSFTKRLGGALKQHFTIRSKTIF